MQRDIALPIVPVDAAEKQNRSLLWGIGGSAVHSLLAIEDRVIHNAAPRPDRDALRARPDRASPAATMRAPSQRLRWSRRHRDQQAAWTENTARARIIRCL